MVVNETIEIWRQVPGYEGIVEISSLGRARSCIRVSVSKIGVARMMPFRNLKGSPTDEGYLTVTIGSDGRSKTLKLHRMVAMAFIPNPENKPHVNHKNGIKTDNRLINLEWNTSSENTTHSYKYLGRQSYFADNYNRENKSRPVYCPTLSVSYYSVRDASRELGISTTMISAVCNGDYTHTDGLTFRYL